MLEEEKYQKKKKKKDSHKKKTSSSISNHIFLVPDAPLSQVTKEHGKTQARANWG